MERQVKMFYKLICFDRGKLRALNEMNALVDKVGETLPEH